MELKGIVEDKAREYAGGVGIAAHGEAGTIAVGETGKGPTWSSVKVPIAIAALREGADRRAVDLAITQSNNEAAWNLLALVGLG